MLEIRHYYCVATNATFKKENVLYSLKFRPYENLRKLFPWSYPLGDMFLDIQNNERGEEVEKEECVVSE